MLAPAAGYFFCTALNARKRIVDWRAHEALNARVAAMLRAGGGCDQRPGVGGWDPLYGLSYPFRASLFRAVAAEIAAAKEAEAVRVAAALPPSPRAAWHAVPPAGAPPFRLRVGFVSADLRQHVMAFLTRGLFEHIAGDAPTRGGRRRRRRALDVWAFSLNADDGSEWRRSIEESVADAARDERGGGGDDDGDGGGGGGEGGRFVDLSAHLEADAAAARLRAAGCTRSSTSTASRRTSGRSSSRCGRRPSRCTPSASQGRWARASCRTCCSTAPPRRARRARADRAPRADAALLPGERPPQLRGRGARGGGDGGGGGDRGGGGAARRGDAGQLQPAVRADADGAARVVRRARRVAARVALAARAARRRGGARVARGGGVRAAARAS